MGKLFTLVSYALRDSSKSRIVLTLIVISLSVMSAAVLLTNSIFEGFQEALRSGAINTLGHIIIHPKGEALVIEDIDDVMRRIGDMDTVETESRRSYMPAAIKINEKYINPYTVLGVDDFGEHGASRISESIIEGEYIRQGRDKDIVIGINLADALRELTYDKKRIAIGEEIDIVTTKVTFDTYTIVGIVDTKNFLSNWMVIMPKKELERLDSTRKDSEIIVRITDESNVENVKRDISALGLPISVATWREEAGYIEDIMSAVSFITVLINRMLLVSVFVVISIIIFINIFQKRRQIGILKSMGASDSFVISIYVLETCTYALLSYTLGTLFFFLMHQYSIAHPIPLLIGDFQTSYTIEGIRTSLIILFVAAVGGSFIPATIAAKTRIIDVLHGQG